MQENKRKIGRFLRERRETLNITQEELCGRKFSIRELQRIEKGEYFPRFDIYMYICNKLYIDFSDIIRQVCLSYKELQNIKFFTIHKQTLKKTDIALIKKEIIMILQLDILPYQLKIEMLYLAMYFDVRVNIDDLNQVIQYLLKYNTDFTEMEAELLAAIIKKDRYQTMINQIINYQNTILKNKGYIYPIIYGLCIYYYNAEDWNSICMLLDEVFYMEIRDWEGDKYLPYLYAQYGIAEYYMTNFKMNDKLEKAIDLSNRYEIPELQAVIAKNMQKSEKGDRTVVDIKRKSR